MTHRKNKGFWPLDNAAKIYPPTTSALRPHVFSFSVILTDPVEPEVLRKATDSVLKRNQTFNTKLLRGKFWYYLEENNAPTVIFDEEPYYLKSIDYKKNNGYLFKLSFVENRLTIVYYHALTDGTGGFNFFSQILLEYFSLMNYDIDSEGIIRTVDTPFFFEEGDDSFLTYSKPAEKHVEKLKTPYAINGTKFDYDGVGIITAVLKVSQLKQIASKLNATLTGYLCGLYIYTVYNSLMKIKPTKNKRFTLLVPCNLRKKYGGNTMRNFAMFARISHDFANSEMLLDDCVRFAQSQISEQLTKDNLDKIINGYVKTEKNPFVKIVPLGIKDFIMRLAYRKVGESLQSGLLSNLGAVNLPKSFEKYIKHVTFCIAPTYSCRQQVGVIGYNDNLYVTFTRDYVENTIEKDFIRALTEKNLDVNVFSNYWESEI